jgi:hypothetical protein
VTHEIANNQSPERLAEKLVVVVKLPSSRLWTVQLSGLLDKPVNIFEHANRSLVSDKAKQVRAFLAALLKSCHNQNPMLVRRRSSRRAAKRATCCAGIA